MSADYASLCETRRYQIDNVDLWLWPQTDQGAWHGPILDWQRSHREKYLRHTPGRTTVVQAGGNCGLYPRLLADIFDSVYTFEPDPLNFFCLANNCQKDNIFKFQAALGDKHAMVQVNRLSMGNVGMHKVSENPAARVPQFTIDDLDLSSFDLLMLDIEGYELNALRGGIKSIEKFKPTIVVENNNKSIVDLLSPLGYRETEKSMMDTILTVE